MYFDSYPFYLSCIFVISHKNWVEYLIGAESNCHNFDAQMDY